MMPWSKLGGVFQVYMKFLHERFSAFPLALTLYHIYIYQHKTCSTSRLMRYEVSLVTMCRNFQTPPDLVVKFQPFDIVDVILWPVLRPHVVYQREIKG